jgi:hypothetical protein
MRKSRIASRTIAEWEALQAAYKAAYDRTYAHTAAMKAKYGENAYTFAMNRTERTTQSKLYSRQSAASEACSAWLETFAAPRQWSSGVPAHWLYTCLTYADAMTYGRMSEVPPVAYGSTPAYARQFAEPIPHSQHRHVVAGCEPCAIWNRVLGEPVRA